MQRQKNNLKFKVIQISSEDQDYPASELLNPSPKSRGWQSQRNCTYPQMITIQFLNPVIVHSLAYLSHHYKISSSVSLQICFDQDQNYQQMKFRKIGKFILSNNEHNDFRSRELKTVFIDSPAHYLKIILNEPYQNQLNIFQQVGVVGIQFFGENVSQPNFNQQMPQVGINQQMGQMQSGQMQQDEDISNLMQNLMMQKQQALVSQDYQSAQMIQNQLDQLMQIHSQILMLEQQKNLAVQNNDFDQAIAIVEQIKKIKALQNVQSSSIRQSQASFNIPQEKFQKQSHFSKNNLHENEENFEQDLQVNEQQNNLSGKRSGRVRRHYKRNKSKPNEDSFQQKEEEENQYEIENQQPREEYVDDRPLPTQQKNNNNQMKEFPTEEEEQKVDPDEIKLSKKQLQEMQPFLGTFRENFLKKCFSSQWSHKQEACEQIQNYLQNKKNLNQVPNDFIETSNWNFAISELWNLSLNFVDNSVPKINQNGLDIIQSITELISSQQINLKKDYEKMMQQGNQILMKQTQELKNEKMVAQLTKIFVLLLRSKLMDKSSVIEKLSQEKIGKKKLNFKELISRCNFIGSLLQNCNIKSNQIDQFLSFGQKCLENSNKQVRNSATELLIVLKDKFGMDDLLDYFQKSNLRRPLYEELLKNLKKSSKNQTKKTTQNSAEEEENFEQQNLSNEEEQEDEEVNQMIENEYEQNFQEVMEQDEQEESDLCNFCQRINKDEMTDEQYDMHLWKECPMLMFCEFCQQVVEVSEFNMHLLNECNESEYFSKCPRCQNAIANDELEDHLENMQCKVLRINQGFQRCPLCQLDLKVNQEDPDETWRNHLVVHGCPKNDRTN